MEKKLTHAQQMRSNMQESMLLIMAMLEWDMMQYCMFKYECGLKYLQAYLQGNMEDIDIMERSIAYWGWWKLHWFMREQEFLKKAPQLGKHRRMRDFLILNNPVDLARAVTLQGRIMEDSYSKDLVPELKT